jgi:non-ribosomal peptide synthetase component F
MTLLAAFATLLYRVTGVDDILIGSPIANRSRVELEGLIGFFSNTLVLRVRLGGNPTFRELARRVREVALGAYANQDLPFEKIVEVARPARTSSVNPLFQVNFRVQSGGGATLALSELEIEPLRVDVGLSRFDLALELHLENDAIGGYLEYNIQLFAPETADRLSHDFQQLLGDVLTRPDTPLLELKLASAADGPTAAPRTRHIHARRRRLSANSIDD